MTWASLFAEDLGVLPGPIPFHNTHASRRPHAPATYSLPSTPAPLHAETLGAASASGRWQWAGAPSPSLIPAQKQAAVRVPPLLLEEMCAAAQARGRSLSEIWAEAAREWLRQHAHSSTDEPQPPTPAAAALPIPKPARSWAAIDAVLADLRRSPDSAA